MSGKSDEDYWFASETKAFDFGDEITTDNASSNTDDSFKKLFPKSYVPVKLLLPDGALDKILDKLPEDERRDIRDKTQRNNYSTQLFPRSSVSVTLFMSHGSLENLLNGPSKENDEQEKLMKEQVIKDIVFGKKYHLDVYRNLEEKSELLDIALKTEDGNTIMTVILFLEKTLQKSLLYKVLSSRPVAVYQYAVYLIFHSNISELTDMLMVAGLHSTLCVKLFKIIVQCEVNNATFSTFLTKIQNLYNNHIKDYMSHNKDDELLKKYLSLLEWQKTVCSLPKMERILGNSVNECLARCCEHYWGAAENHLCNPQKFCKNQEINERLFHWLFLEIKTSQKCWEDVLNMFVKFIWYRNKHVINSPLKLESIIVLLNERNAPEHIIEKFLTLVEDSEQVLSLAMKTRSHQYVINHFVSERDRCALLNYKSKISRHTSEYAFIENVLSSKDIKWKN